ncbi:acyltransferase [Zoogloea oleivorans]|uniref:Acyltransferase n=1 Tax=Zoogloea oleivorans TaxID=1552750 RepID=A0A6C2CDN8_9RHOO|nr:acyltransferase [Zoogloea oleivorans]TYC51816.1 acyltransferase [Zoogloea oleivorans]
MKRVAGFVKYLFLRVSLGKVRYLRYLGAQIGDGCEVITPIINFGSEPWLVKIGNGVTVTHGVKFVTHDASTRLFRNKYSEMNSRFGNKFGPISIGSNVFIGVNAIVLPGVSIGDNVVVGAGSLVNKDVKSGTVVAGVPAKEVCSIAEYEEKCVRNLILVKAETSIELRRELTERFWGRSL